MRIVLFCHSLISDWNHGNAHFLRGVVCELLKRDNEVLVYEPRNGWSMDGLVAERGPAATGDVFRFYPALRGAVRRYDPKTLDLDAALDGADLVLVHEWNDPGLVAAIGRKRRGAGFRLFFHDTHHRSVSDPAAIAALDLRDYDGVLAFGGMIRDLYLQNGWAGAAWTWHEAADTAVFAPRRRKRHRALVWIGNWGDGERDRGLSELLLDPIRRLELGATLYGVRYPPHALAAIATAGADYAGGLPNYLVPDAFAAHRVTVHVPRGYYAGPLSGIPTIRPFEALACGIPLISGPWDDSEGLFRAGEDYLVAGSSDAMTEALRAVLSDPSLARRLVRSGRARVLERHTCAHRVDELLTIHTAVAGSHRRRRPSAPVAKEISG